MEAVLPPVIAAYAIFVSMVLLSRGQPVMRPRARWMWLGPHRRGIVRHLAVTAAAGYVVFLAIVAIFHTWLGNEPDAIGSAFTEGSLLTISVAAVFAAAAADRPARRR